VVAVSMSWGFSEFRKETADNPIFTTPSGHTGITFVAASGDSGSSAGPEWPSTAPTVLAVGGTTLYVDGAGNYQYELPWVGSGGGYSRIQPEPGYQRSVQGTGQRSTPDVAFNGDPNTGVLVYETSAESGVGSWQVVGGTSLGTPAWAALIAIVDQGRNLAGEGSLDGGSQTLPDLYALPSSAFHVVGSSGTRHGQRRHGPRHTRRLGACRRARCQQLGDTPDHEHGRCALNQAQRAGPRENGGSTSLARVCRCFPRRSHHETRR
jgi:hypothetical protein